MEKFLQRSRGVTLDIRYQDPRHSLGRLREQRIYGWLRLLFVRASGLSRGHTPHKVSSSSRDCPLVCPANCRSRPIRLPPSLLARHCCHVSLLSQLVNIILHSFPLHPPPGTVRSFVLLTATYLDPFACHCCHVFLLSELANSLKHSFPLSYVKKYQ